MPALAKTLTQDAYTDITARTATKLDMEAKTARKGPNEVFGLQPKCLHHNLWTEGSILSPTTAEWSETALPLPHPPLSETSNPLLNKTIVDNPDLFQVLTPIKADVFKSLLKNHPKLAFIQPVCTGLQEGFWSWADTLNGDFPLQHDESRLMPKDDKKVSFLYDQCLKERHKFFLESFRENLLPGMYSMPIYAIPKPHSEDLHMVTDHSVGSFSLNSMIDHSRVTGFPLDNIWHLGEMLLDAHQSIGNVPLTLWKSYIADTYPSFQ